MSRLSTNALIAEIRGTKPWSRTACWILRRAKAELARRRRRPNRKAVQIASRKANRRQS